MTRVEQTEQALGVIERVNHELRQIDHQIAQLREWMEPVIKEIEHLKCWRNELVELREHQQRMTIRITRCEPGPGPDRRTAARRKEDADPTLAKLKNLSAGQLADLMALLEQQENE